MYVIFNASLGILVSSEIVSMVEARILVKKLSEKSPGVVYSIMYLFTTGE